MKPALRRAVASPIQTELRAPTKQVRCIGTMGSVPWRSWGALTMGQGKKGGGWACGGDRRGECELWQTANNSVDEKVVELFGHDIWPWVHVPAGSQELGTAGNGEYHIRWEQAVYSQMHDVRNDLVHHQVESSPHRMVNPPQDVLFAWDSADPEHAPSYVTNTSGPQQVYYGAYPDRYGHNPGKYWEQLLNNKGAVQTRMLWDQSKKRTQARWGGHFVLPGDEWNTIEGVKPLLSALGWRNLKYNHHETLVKELNAALPPALKNNAYLDMPTCLKHLDFNHFAELRALAMEHFGLCIFYRSIRPRGGIMRAEVGEELVQNFGSVNGFIDQMYEAGVSYDGEGDCDGAFLWLLQEYDGGGENTLHGSGSSEYALKIVVSEKGETPYAALERQDGDFGRAFDEALHPLMACPLGKSAWGTDYDSRDEFLARFFDVIDWDHAHLERNATRRLDPPQQLMF